MKFGGASVAHVEQFPQIADLIMARKTYYKRIAIVISAMGETTNQLISLANQIHPEPPQREYDMLISTGERVSMSLLAMALCRKNCEAVSFTGSQSGIITCSRHTNARVIDVRPNRLLQTFQEDKVVIIAGFQGVSEQKEITTLGRGGSDVSAVALALALQADVEFLKDVPGIFDYDPKKNHMATQYQSLTYSEALQIVNQGARVLHPRAIELAAKNGLPLHVRSFISSYQDNKGTFVCEAGRLREKSPRYEEV